MDWGIHLIDAARNILGEKTPRAVTATGGLYELQGKITTPDTLTVNFEFERCPLLWRHRIWGSAEWAPEVNNGIFFYGEKETVFVSDNRWVAIPREKGAQRRVTDAKSDAGGLHMANFLECVRTRATPVCQPEDAWWSTATVQLAMISYRAGGTGEVGPGARADCGSRGGREAAQASVPRALRASLRGSLRSGVPNLREFGRMRSGFSLVHSTDHPGSQLANRCTARARLGDSRRAAFHCQRQIQAGIRYSRVVGDGKVPCQFGAVRQEPRFNFADGGSNQQVVVRSYSRPIVNECL